MTEKIEKNSRTRKTGLWWKITLAVMLLLATGLLVTVLNIETIALRQVNKALATYCSGGGALESIAIHLRQGSIELDGLRVNSPDGFGKTPLLALGTMVVDVVPTSLLADEIIVEQLVIKDLAVSVVRDEKGVLSISRLVPSSQTVEKDGGTDSSGEQAPASVPAIVINSVRIENVTFHLTDRKAGEQWSAGIRVDAGVDEIRLKDLLKRDVLVGRLDLALTDLHVDQPDGFSRGPLMTLHKIALAAADLALTSDRWPIEKVSLDQLQLSLERNQDGSSNIEQLIRGWLPDASDAEQKKADIKPARQAPSFDSVGAMPTLVFGDVQLSNIAMQVRDGIEGKPWQAGFERLDVAIKALMVGDVAKMALAVNAFQMDLSKVAADQAPGFDGKTIASLNHLQIRTDALNLADSEVVVKEIQVQGLNANVFVPADGVSNVATLTRRLAGKPDTISDESTSPAKEDNPPMDKSKEAATASDIKRPMVRFEKINVSESAIHYMDSAIAETPLDIPLENILLDARQLRLFDTRPDAADPARISLTFDLKQKEPLPLAHFLALARLGPLSDQVPPTNAQMRLVGLKLDTLGSLVSPATRASLGASGLDANLSMALNKKAIDLYATILSDRNIKYNAIHLKGPLTNPEIEMGAILAGVFNRVSGGLVNVGKHSVEAGVEIAKGGISAVGAVGSGALRITANLGKSLFKVASGMATLDGQEVKQGVVGSTKGTAELTVGTVAGTGKAAAGGVKDSFSDLKGDATTRKWDAQIPERFESATAQAREELEQMPYPPVVRWSARDGEKNISTDTEAKTGKSQPSNEESNR